MGSEEKKREEEGELRKNELSRHSFGTRLTRLRCLSLCRVRAVQSSRWGPEQGRNHDVEGQEFGAVPEVTVCTTPAISTVEEAYTV